MPKLWVGVPFPYMRYRGDWGNDRNWAEHIFYFILGTIAFVFTMIWKLLCLIVSGIKKVLGDILKSMYGKIIAGLATLALVALGMQFFSSLLN